MDIIFPMRKCAHIHVTGEGASQVCEDCEMQMTRAELPAIPEHACAGAEHSRKHDTAVTAWDATSETYLCYHCMAKNR